MEQQDLVYRGSGSCQGDLLHVSFELLIVGALVLSEACHGVFVLGPLRRISCADTGQLLSMLSPGPTGRSCKVICS